MIPSAFSSILFISCIILVHGIHPLKQFQEHIELKPLSYFNETSFVEAQGLITASLTVFLKKKLMIKQLPQLLIKQQKKLQDLLYKMMPKQDILPLPQRLLH